MKLIIADAPYDGLRKSSTSATKRAIDGNTAAETCKLIQDLLELSSSKMAKGGALVLFRPGAAMDPPWLGQAVAKNGWVCEWVLTWNKTKKKLGHGNAPYGIASERLLVLSRRGQKLVVHDDSDRDDIIEFKPIQSHYSDSDPHHQCEKPLDLIRHLIGKHTHEGELVVEPFGGTGPACQAAVEMNRHWLYCETVKENFDMAMTRIGMAAEKRQKSAA